MPTYHSLNVVLWQVLRLVMDAVKRLQMEHDINLRDVSRRVLRGA
jgi:hypothetical protein